MKYWLSQLVAPRRPARRNPAGVRLTPRLEQLEVRDAPAITVGPLINISKMPGHEAETAIIINPKDVNNLFATSTVGDVNKYSFDGGKTWADSDRSAVLGGGGIGDQQMAWDEFGNLFMTYFAGANGNTVVAYSTDGGASFKLSLDTGSLMDQPEIAAAKGFVVVDYTNGSQREVKYAAVTGLGQIGTWSAGQRPTNDGTFGDIEIGANGQVMLAYQENNGSDAPARMFLDLDPDGPGPQGFKSITPPASMTNVGSFDYLAPQPDRSVDAEMNLAWDRSGGAFNNRVYLVWTDELPDESDDMDIFISFSDDDGATWSAKRRLNDDAVGNGKAQILPAIAVDQAKGTVAVTWYDARNSSDNKKVQVFATTSRDGGVTWDANTQISKGFIDGTANNTMNLGDYDQMDFVGGVFYRTWADNSNSTGDNPDGAGSGLDIYTAMCKASLPPVILSLSANPNPIIEGEKTALTGEFTDPDSPNDPFRVVVDWGDGSAPTSVRLPAGKKTFTIEHQYVDGTNAPTQITVQLFDADGNEAVGTTFLNVFSTPPTAFITGVPDGAVPEGKKLALGSFVESASPFKTFSYKWSVVSNGVQVAESLSPGLSFIPPDEGVYDVFLTVTDNVGGVGTADPVEIVVNNVAPTAAGLTNDGPKKPGETLRLTVLNPTDAAADVPGLLFDFDTDGDGAFDTTTSKAFADVTFADEGFYTLKARVRDADGGVSAEHLTDVLISATGGGNGLVVTKRFIAVGSDTSPRGVVQPTSMVRVLNLNGTEQFALQPFGDTFAGGVRVATGDVNGDKVEDIIAAPGPKGGSSVLVFSGVDGSELTLPSLFAVYGFGYSKGMFVASGDFNRDGYADVVVAPGPGTAVPVIGISGFDGAELFRVSPFGAKYKGGVSVAAGDVDGDRRADLIVGQMTGGNQVKVFLYTEGGLSANPVRTLSAMPKAYKGGVFVAAGDVDGDRRADIIVGSNASGRLESRVRVFSGANFALVRDFVPFPAYRMGVRVAAEDLDGDGKADLVVVPARPSSTVGTNPRVIGLSGRTLAGRFSHELTDWAFQGGVFVG